MKSIRFTLWLLLTAAIGVLNAQTTIVVGKDTLVSRQWVREYVSSMQKAAVPAPVAPPATIPVVPPTLPHSPDVTDVPADFTPISSEGVQFIVNGTGNSIDFSDPDCISPDKKELFRSFVQGENGVDAVRLAFSWGEYNPSEGVYRNEGLAKAIRWIKSLRPENPPKIRFLFVPILRGNDSRIPSNEIQTDNNGNQMDCTYNSLFTTVPSYFSPTAAALLYKCYDHLIPFLWQNFANDIQVLEIAAGQSEEHYMPFTSQAGGNPCGKFSGIGDYSEVSRDAFRKQYGADLPNVGVTFGDNWNMNYNESAYRNAAKFWGSGISGIWDRFRGKVKQHSKFKVGMVIPDLLNDQGARWIFHGFALPDMLAKCDVFYHSYNLSSSFWYANLLGTDLLEGTRPGEVISETEVDPYDCGTNNGFGPIDEQFLEKSFTKTIEHGGKGIHFSMTWDGGQISQMKRVIGKIRAKNPQAKSRKNALTVEAKMSEIYHSSYFLDHAWKRAGNDPNNPFSAEPVNIRLINDL